MENGGQDNYGNAISVSARIPNRTVYLALSGLASLCVAIGAAVYQKADDTSSAYIHESSERAEVLAANAVDLASDAVARVTALSAQLDALRISVLQGTSDRYTKTENDKLNAVNQREHEILKQADASHDRQLNQHSKELEDLRRELRR